MGGFKNHEERKAHPADADCVGGIAFVAVKHRFRGSSRNYATPVRA